jgi:hypothetical protein
MAEVNVHEAKTHLARVASGEEVMRVLLDTHSQGLLRRAVNAT